jgi:hypothetical protein
MMKRAALLCFFLALPLPAKAQTTLSGLGAGSTTKITRDAFGVGVAVNLGTGSGLSLRHHLGSLPIAYQASGYWWNEENTLEYNAGLELQFDLVVRRTNRLYALVGGAYYYSGNPLANTLRGPIRIAGGVGYEEYLGRTLGISLNVTATSYQPKGDFDIYPFGGVHFYFR